MKGIAVLNPQAGRGKARDVATLLSSTIAPGLEFQSVFLDKSRMERQVTLLGQEADLLLIGGGDGTISQVVSIIASLPKPPIILPIPLGTGNDIARATGWVKFFSRYGLNQLVSAIRYCEARQLDIWEIKDAGRFCGYAGAGVDGAIVANYTRLTKNRILKRLPFSRRLLYFGAAILYLAGHQRSDWSLEAQWDHGEVKVGGGGALILSNISSYGGGLCHLPGARFDDGLLELYRVTGIKQFLHLFFGKAEKRAQVSRLTLKPKRSLPLQLDGEFAGMLQPERDYYVRCIRTIPVLIPPEDLKAKAKEEPKKLSFAIDAGERELASLKKGGRL